MKISTAFRNAFRVGFGRPGATLKFLVVELCLTLICLAPLAFLFEKGLEFLALLAVPLWVLIMFPARMNAAEAMQDSLGNGSLFSLRLANPADWGGKILFGLRQALCLVLWGAPMTAALVYAWIHYSGEVDAFTLLQLIQKFGGGDVKTGVKYLVLIFLGTLLLLLIGIAFHSGARHARALGNPKLVNGHHGKVMLTWLCSLVMMLPLLVALGVCVLRYWPVLSNLSGLVSGSIHLPSTKETLIILAAGGVLTLPLLPVRSLVTAALVHQAAPESGENPA